jgi:hypothetical protein
MDESRPRVRYGEAFWRAHHEAWQRSDLNQREYCEAQGIPLKAFWQLAGEVQSRTEAIGVQTALPARRPKSQSKSHPKSLLESCALSLLRSSRCAASSRRSSAQVQRTNKRQILEEAAQPGASLAQIARCYGIARRVLCRWKQELAPPVFVAVEITDPCTV